VLLARVTFSTYPKSETQALELACMFAHQNGAV
jgi:hypothetical protein